MHRPVLTESTSLTVISKSFLPSLSRPWRLLAHGSALDKILLLIVMPVLRQWYELELWWTRNTLQPAQNYFSGFMAGTKIGKGFPQLIISKAFSSKLKAWYLCRCIYKAEFFTRSFLPGLGERTYSLEVIVLAQRLSWICIVHYSALLSLIALSWYLNNLQDETREFDSGWLLSISY